MVDFCVMAIDAKAIESPCCHQAGCDGRSCQEYREIRMKRELQRVFSNEGSDICGFSNREMLYPKVQHERC